MKSKELHIYTVRLAAPETEFSAEFVQQMANRMAVSYHKYGPIADGYPDNIDALVSLDQRIRLYQQTGNTEYLVDVANFALIEYLRPGHPMSHFTATDSDGSPGRTTVTGVVTHARNDEVA